MTGTVSLIVDLSCYNKMCVTLPFEVMEVGLLVVCLVELIVDIIMEL